MAHGASTPDGRVASAEPGAPAHEAGASADAGSQPLPLAELDRALAPLRRTVAYALRDGGPVRYLEVNGGRWLGDALRLDLPHAIRDGLATVGGKLAGYDEADDAERRERLRVINQSLARIDAVLGLPLHAEIARPRPAQPAPTRQPEPAGAEAPPRRGRPKKDRKAANRREPRAAKDEAEEDRDEDESEADRPHRLGDPRVTGQSLLDLGTDPELAKALAAHGIQTLFDLLWHAPVSETVIRPVQGAGRALEAGPAAVGGRVRARATVVRPDGSRGTVLRIVGAGPLRVALASAAPDWLLDRLQPGTRVVLAGTFRPEEGTGGVLEDAEWVPEAASHAVHLACYGLEGVDDRAVRQELIRLAPLLGTLRDPLARGEQERRGLDSLGDALRLAHGMVSAHPDARRRLAWEEALAVAMGLSRREDARQRGIGHPILHGLLSRIARFHELALVDPQQAALEEIKRDLRRSSPMLRLLTGEVGVGQGTVSLAATILVAETKSQVLQVAPDQATAEARYLFAEPVLKEVGLVARLLDAKPSRSQRDAVRRGEVHVAFGAASLLDADLEFRRLGLVVAEEGTVPRHTAQRVARMKPPRPDVLVQTTAPVATTALLRAYADHTISELGGVIERGATAEVIASGDRLSAYEQVAGRVAAGEQAWVFFPMVRGHDVLDAREVARVKATLESQVFDGARIGVFHGGMGRDERYRVYHDFRHHRYDVLIATTIVEDGFAIPDATLAVVEHADKLSWRRAMRLRGHVARGRRDSTVFFILGEHAEEASVEALRQVATAGMFDAAIADALNDVEWPEDAPPEPRFTWLRPHHDRALVLAAHALAHELLATDPGLRGSQSAELARTARALWPRLLDVPCPIPEASSGSRRRRRRRKRK